MSVAVQHPRLDGVNFDNSISVTLSAFRPAVRLLARLGVLSHETAGARVAALRSRRQRSARQAADAEGRHSSSCRPQPPKPNSDHQREAWFPRITTGHRLSAMIRMCRCRHGHTARRSARRFVMAAADAPKGITARSLLLLDRWSALAGRFAAAGAAACSGIDSYRSCSIERVRLFCRTRPRRRRFARLGGREGRRRDRGSGCFWLAMPTEAGTGLATRTRYAPIHPAPTRIRLEGVKSASFCCPRRRRRCDRAPSRRPGPLKNSCNEPGVAGLQPICNTQDRPSRHVGCGSDRAELSSSERN
jgi:hypothetical protein